VIQDSNTAVAASEEITESLRRTRQVMAEQIGATDANTRLIGRIPSSEKAAALTEWLSRDEYGDFDKSRRRIEVAEENVHQFSEVVGDHVMAGCPRQVRDAKPSNCWSVELGLCCMEESDSF